MILVAHVPNRSLPLISQEQCGVLPSSGMLFMGSICVLKYWFDHLQPSLSIDTKAFVNIATTLISRIVISFYGQQQGITQQSA